MIGMSPRPVIWTVGHSNHSLDRFVALVCEERIEFLVDVRSYPYSRVAPHFNRENLQPSMEERGVRYAFLGLALGGRPQREEHFDAEGHALYGKMAGEPAFEKAIDGLLNGAEEHRIALMCSCGQPAGCHRRLLVGKVLCDRGAELHHILPDGNVETEQSISLSGANGQPVLFGHDPVPWRSTRSVSRRRRLSASSAG
jgi:uncharacterized protein (DUF488 family)